MKELFALLGIVGGFSLLFTGLHNIDNAWNIQNLNNYKEPNSFYVDSIPLLDIYIDHDKLYNLGIINVFAGAMLILVSSYLQGRFHAN